MRLSLRGLARVLRAPSLQIHVPRGSVRLNGRLRLSDAHAVVVAFRTPSPSGKPIRGRNYSVNQLRAAGSSHWGIKTFRISAALTPLPLPSSTRKLISGGMSESAAPAAVNDVASSAGGDQPLDSEPRTCAKVAIASPHGMRCDEYRDSARPASLNEREACGVVSMHDHLDRFRLKRSRGGNGGFSPQSQQS